MLAEPDVPPRQDAADESLAAFVRRRFGQEALDLFGDSLLAGIHVGDPDRLSMRATFPNYVQLENTYGSLIRGLQARASEDAATALPADPDMPRTAFVSLRNGVAELIEGLQARLTGDVRTGQAITYLDPDRTLTTSAGEKLRPDAVILTTPAHAAGRLVGDAAPEAGRALTAIRSSSSGTVSLGYRAEQIDHPLDGFGFVVPRGEARILASTWSSTKLRYRAPHGYVLIRVFVGGHEHPADVDLPEGELVTLAQSELQRILGIRAEPVVSRVFRWRDANPQYEIGHLDRLATLAAQCPPWLHLAGCSYTGVGIPDCVRQGREAARRAAT
jgi:oxygen-dependent protoporphyrinogen oxidase